MNAAIFVTDSGEFSWIDLNRYIPRILAEVNQAGDERLGITLGLRVMPLFREALFAVNGKCFVAKLQTVYVGENGESRRKLFVGSHRIGEMHVEPIENRDAVFCNAQRLFDAVAKECDWRKATAAEIVEHFKK